MKSNKSLIGAAIAAAALSGVSAMGALTPVPGTYVTDPAQVASAPVIATSTSAVSGDAVALRVANDSTNVYVNVTFNSAIDGNVYLAIDSDNDPGTGYAIFSNPLIGSNFGLNFASGFTETAGNFNSDPAYFGSGSGSVTPATFAESTTATTLTYTIPLTTAQSDAGDTGGYTGLVFPSSNFTIEAYQTSDGNTLGPVEYTIAAVPEPVSMSLLALAATPLLRRRSKRV